MGKVIGIVQICLGCLMVSAVHAGMIDKEGMAPWEICGLCHNLNGISPMARFPKLAGQKPQYIEKQFWDFHSEKRSNDGGQMQAITTEVDADTVPAIADYFAGLVPPPALSRADAAISESQYRLGRELFNRGRDGIPACSSCHDNVQHPAPWLFAQHRDYLQKQLRDFKDGSRANDGGVMGSLAKQLTEVEIDAVTAYLAVTQPRNPGH